MTANSYMNCEKDIYLDIKKETIESLGNFKNKGRYGTKYCLFRQRQTVKTVSGIYRLSI